MAKSSGKKGADRGPKPVPITAKKLREYAAKLSKTASRLDNYATQMEQAGIKEVVTFEKGIENASAAASEWIASFSRALIPAIEAHGASFELTISPQNHQ